MAELKLADARELCTPAELELYQLSRGRALTSQSAAELQKNRTRSRQLRDKWRDLSTKQRRTLQQAKGTRVVEKTERSALKAQLFQEALERFEKQLEKASTSDASPANGTTKRVPSQKRTAEHRQTRAAVRKKLQTKVDVLVDESSKRKDRPKTARKTTPAAASSDSQPADSTPEKKLPKRSKPTHPHAGEATPHVGLQVNPVQQSVVQAEANRQRKQISGLTTRVQGHVSGRGKRDQAARNQRKRT